MVEGDGRVLRATLIVEDDVLRSDGWDGDEDGVFFGSQRGNDDDIEGDASPEGSDPALVVRSAVLREERGVNGRGKSPGEGLVADLGRIKDGTDATRGLGVVRENLR